MTMNVIEDIVNFMEEDCNRMINEIAVASQSKDEIKINIEYINGRNAVLQEIYEIIERHDNLKK